MKTKGKDLELVRLSIHATVEQTIFFQLQSYQYPLKQHNSNFFEVKQNSFKVEHQSKVTQFIGHE